jgi:hypothetical protein
MSVLTFVIGLITAVIKDRMLYKPVQNVEALVHVIRPYVTITSAPDAQNSELTFPEVTRMHVPFSYTEEQRDKLFGMLGQQIGIGITDGNITNLFGDEIPKNTRNALLGDIVSKLSGANKKGGTEISRLSGWYSQEIPKKFKFIAEQCALRKRLVIYSRYQTVALRLVGFLTERGFGARIQNLNASYPSFDALDVQNKFRRDRDIVVLHPKMTEGIGITGASMLVIMEPFVDAAMKQQLEARVVRLGRYGPGERVTIAICATGIDLVNDPFEDKSIWKTLQEHVLAMVSGLMAAFKTFKLPRSMKNFDGLLENPPWLKDENVGHLHIGPEIAQELNLKSLESLLESFRVEAEQLLRAR